MLASRRLSHPTGARWPAYRRNSRMIPADRVSALTPTLRSAAGSTRHGNRTCDYRRCLRTLIGDALGGTALSGDRPIPVFHASLPSCSPLSRRFVRCTIGSEIHMFTDTYDGGRDWDRTSDPYDVNVVMRRLQVYVPTGFSADLATSRVNTVSAGEMSGAGIAATTARRRSGTSCE
jgi:hypothetical protein